MATMVEVEEGPRRGRTPSLSKPEIKRRIADSCDTLEWSLSKLAKEVGVAHTTITRFMDDESHQKSLHTETLERIFDTIDAEYLKRAQNGVVQATVYDPEIGLSDTIWTQLPNKVPIIGEVQAGVWHEPKGKMPSDDGEYVEWASDGRYPEAKRFGLRVVGPSMNEVLPEGCIAVCVRGRDIGLTVGPNGNLESGRYVVVERQRMDLVETTVKQYILNNGTVELYPRSTHPEFQEPLELTDGDDSEEIRVSALVLGFQHNL